MLDRFVERGGNFIDTANAYHAGASEEIIGRWLKQRGGREQLVLATKVFGTMGHAPNEQGLSRKHILAQVDASLERLDTTYVDLYQTHYWDPATPLEETLSTLNDLVRAGKVRYIGASNYTGWQLMKALMISRAKGWEEFVSMQPEYNLLSRQVEYEVLPACRDGQLGVMPWGPLGGGWLTGKYHRGVDRPQPNTRVAETALPWQPDSWERRNNEHTWAVIDAVVEVARRRGATPAQVALNWLRAKPEVTVPILGARSPEQLDDNLACVEWQLEQDELAYLDTVSSLPLPDPYYLIQYVTRKRRRDLVE
jgi:aryl-alcohol dehydrogenase-like predicted oxidoreductase